MRITGGTHRGRTLTSPKGRNTRPTSDRTRLSIFNILLHGTWHPDILTDATVLDIFAGTGALGLEALSQGAKHAAFIERDHTFLVYLFQQIVAQAFHLMVRLVDECLNVPLQVSPAPLQPASTSSPDRNS